MEEEMEKQSILWLQMHYTLLQILSPVLNDGEFRASALKQKSSKELWRILNNFLNILFLKQTTLQENLEKPEFKLQHKICLQIQGENIFCMFRRKTKHLHRFCLAFSAVLAKQYWKNLYHFGYLMLVELKEKHIMYKISQETTSTCFSNKFLLSHSYFSVDFPSINSFN